MIVLDMNGTLLKRVSTSLDPYTSKNIHPSATTKAYAIFLRPNTSTLISTLNTLNLDYMFWTNCNPKNTAILTDFLVRNGFTRSRGSFSIAECVKGKVKDLRVVSRKYKVRVEDCLLVDDSCYKGNGCEMIEVAVYDPMVEDDELLRVSEKIEAWYKERSVRG